MPEGTSLGDVVTAAGDVVTSEAFDAVLDALCRQIEDGTLAAEYDELMRKSMAAWRRDTDDAGRECEL